VLKGLLSDHYLPKKERRSGRFDKRPRFTTESIRLATKLREDLMNYEERLGSSREFAEIMNSAGALIVAITEPEEFRLFASQCQKARDGSSGNSLPHLAK
jgi:hypothetical protein